MPEKHLYEYAVIRIVPRVEREEFLNVGVIVYAHSLKFLGMRYKIDTNKLQHFSDSAAIWEMEEHLQAYQQISMGTEAGGPIAKLDLPSRFRWLTATRSTIVQCSKVHSGFCTDPQEALTRLYEQFVG